MTVSDMVLKIAVKIGALGASPIEPAIDAVNGAIRFLALKLADRNSDLARGNYIKRTAKQTCTLPADFNGFAGKPYVDDVPINPLPIDYDMQTADGTPLYYEVADDTLYLYPAPLESVTVTGKYWSLPEELIAADDIPYGGKFDSLLLTMATGIAISGYSVMHSSEFNVDIERGLDLVLFPRRPALPEKRPYISF